MDDEKAKKIVLEVASQPGVPLIVAVSPDGYMHAWTTDDRAPAALRMLADRIEAAQAQEAPIRYN